VQRAGEAIHTTHPLTPAASCLLLLPLMLLLLLLLLMLPIVLQPVHSCGATCMSLQACVKLAWDVVNPRRFPLYARVMHLMSAAFHNYEGSAADYTHCDGHVRRMLTADLPMVFPALLQQFDRLAHP
jgi:hypothetical protein